MPEELPGYAEYLAKEGEFPPELAPYPIGGKFEIPKKGELAREGALERIFICRYYPRCKGKQPFSLRITDFDTPSGTPVTRCQCNLNPRHRWAIQWDSRELESGRVIEDPDAPAFEFSEQS